MAQSFFSTLQAWVKSQFGIDYGGRYVAQLLKQVSDLDPAPFRHFFAHVTSDSRYLRGKFRLETEFGFRCDGRMRRADLAVYVDESPQLLVELKYRDRLADGRTNDTSQLADYLSACRALPSKPKFFLLHRNVQEPADLKKINEGGHFVAPYQALVPFLRKSKSQISVLLLRYLQEEGLVIDQIETDHLTRFFHRLVMPWQGSGRINKAKATNDGPLQFQRLLNNLRLISGDITPKIRRLVGLRVARSATIEFSLTHRYNAKKVDRLLSSTGASEIEISAKERTSGTVDVWAQVALPSAGGWLYLYYGLEFVLQIGKPMKVAGYACFLSPEIEKIPDADPLSKEFGSAGDFPLTVLQSWKIGDLESDFLQMIREAATSTLKSRVVKNRATTLALRRLTRVR